MRRIAAVVAALAFAGAVLQLPWSHVHLHGYDADHHEQHEGLNALHGHRLHAPKPGLHWEAPTADEDAWPLHLTPGIRPPGPTIDLAFETIEPAAENPDLALSWAPDLPARAHGPPVLSTVPPRAPPL